MPQLEIETRQLAIKMRHLRRESLLRGSNPLQRAIMTRQRDIELRQLDIETEQRAIILTPVETILKRSGSAAMPRAANPSRWNPISCESG